MTYTSFEDLPVWQAAIKLGAQTYALTEEPEFRKRHSLRDQIERAAVSASNNIAEGFERGTKARASDLTLYCARLDRRGSVHALPLRRDWGVPKS